MQPQFQLKVLRPTDCANATLRGAVASSIGSYLAISKIAGCHYLFDSLQPHQTGRDPDYYFVTWPDGRPRCKYTYETFIPKGERVNFGEPRKLTVEKFVASGEPLIFEDRIYTCEDDNCPDFVIDPSKTFYGVKYDIYFTPDRLKITVEIVFAKEVVTRSIISF